MEKQKTEKRFDVLGQTQNDLRMEDLIETSHWSNERQERHENILATIGSGELVASFIVDTGHPKGNEIHNIFENGIIMIQNQESEMLVTELIARPNQIKRYWRGLGLDIPRNIKPVLERARAHQSKHYNYW